MKRLSINQRLARHIYKQMLLSRDFDELINRRIAAGEEAPHFHSGTGQEALSVAGVAALEESDYLLYTHRGYGQLLAKGVSPVVILKDMLERVGGTNDGFGSVLHVCDEKRGVVGRDGVFNSRFGIAMGLALAAVRKGARQVVLCYYGEAAGTRGPLYEALNMAVLWKLPLILVAENNGYSISSRTETLYPNGRMSGVWRGFDIPVEVVNGNDAAIVYEAVSMAVERARVGKGPSVIEGLTYRIESHMPGEYGQYRTKEEIDAERQKDPITTFRRNLLSCDWLTEEEDETWREETRAEVERAWREARAAPEPTATQLEQRKILL